MPQRKSETCWIEALCNVVTDIVVVCSLVEEILRENHQTCRISGQKLSQLKECVQRLSIHKDELLKLLRYDGELQSP